MGSCILHPTLGSDGEIIRLRRKSTAWGVHQNAFIRIHSIFVLLFYLTMDASSDITRLPSTRSDAAASAIQPTAAAGPSAGMIGFNIDPDSNALDQNNINKDRGTVCFASSSRPRILVFMGLIAYDACCIDWLF